MRSRHGWLARSRVGDRYCIERANTPLNVAPVVRRRRPPSHRRCRSLPPRRSRQRPLLALNRIEAAGRDGPLRSAEQGRSQAAALRCLGRAVGGGLYGGLAQESRHPHDASARYLQGRRGRARRYLRDRQTIDLRALNWPGTIGETVRQRFESPCGGRAFQRICVCKMGTSLYEPINVYKPLASDIGIVDGRGGPRSNDGRGGAPRHRLRRSRPTRDEYAQRSRGQATSRSPSDAGPKAP